MIVASRNPRHDRFLPDRGRHRAATTRSPTGRERSGADCPRVSTRGVRRGFASRARLGGFREVGTRWLYSLCRASRTAARCRRGGSFRGRIAGGRRSGRAAIGRARAANYPERHEGLRAAVLALRDRTSASGRAVPVSCAGTRAERPERDSPAHEDLAVRLGSAVHVSSTGAVGASYRELLLLGTLPVSRLHLPRAKAGRARYAVASRALPARRRSSSASATRSGHVERLRA